MTMKPTKFEKRIVKIVKSMLYRKTFDVTLLDRYFQEKDVDMNLVFGLHTYIYNTYGEETFMFTDVFDVAFRKIVAKFLLHYPTINIGSLRYELDESKDNPVIFSNEFVQKMFNMWIRKES